MSDLVKRSDEWVKKFLAGKDIDVIATEAGEDSITVGTAVFAVLDRREATESRAGKARERARMNKVLMALMPQAELGDVKAAVAVIKASSELSRLGGFYSTDEPTKGEGSSTESGPRVERLRRLLETPEPDLAQALALAGWVRVRSSLG